MLPRMTEENGGPASKGAITKDTLIPLGSALLIAGAILAGVRSFDARMSSIESKLLDQWSCRDHERFTLLLKISNPTIEVPPHRPCGGDK